MKQGLSLKYVFLVCLVLVVQASLPVKILGLVLLVTIWPDPLTKLKFGSMAYFYFFMLLLGLISTRFLIDSSIRYAMVVVLGSVFWAIALVVHLYSKRISETDHVAWILQKLFVLNTVVSFIQVVYMSVVHGGNPFVDMSSGDKVTGIFSNSSVNMIVMSFFLVYFLYQSAAWKSILSGLVVLATTYMSGIIIFFGVAGCVALIHPAIRLRTKLIVIILGTFLGAILLLASPDNIAYSKQQLSRLNKDDAPRKIISFRQTLAYLVKSPENAIGGAGMGNFSSRLAFSAGGEYADWYPRRWVYRSDDFSKNHFTLWNTEVLSIPFNDGTANQPFSVYNQLLGEYGLVGVFIFFIFYARYLVKNLTVRSYGFSLFLLLIGYFVLDYWFEYFSVVIIFELMALADIEKKNTSHEERY